MCLPRDDAGRAPGPIAWPTPTKLLSATGVGAPLETCQAECVRMVGLRSPPVQLVLTISTISGNFMCILYIIPVRANLELPSVRLGTFTLEASAPEL